jgi:hypothetical protein
MARWESSTGQTPEGVAFGGNGSADEVLAAAKNIRTFTEQIEGHTIRPSIDDALEKACAVICLGFGFHPQNLQLLTPTKGTDRWRPSVGHVSATTKGLNEGNYPTITTFLQGHLRLGPTPILNSCTAAQLLKWYRPTIMLAVT